MNSGNYPQVIAEIGCNHKGDLDIAFEMIKVAATFCDVDVIKFQKRDNRTLLSEVEFDKPHPVPKNSYGNSYGEHREYLEFNIEQHKLLAAECKKFKKEYSTSVWDTVSAKEMIKLNPNCIKIPSAINNNSDVLECLFSDFKGDIHISLGMTTKKEEERIINSALKNNANQRLIIYHCISAYPVEDEDLYLKEIVRLNTDYKDLVKAIGFSGHHKGISADIAALAYGAKYFERHFTLDRTWKGTDHAASLEPDGLRRLNRDLKKISKALKFKKEEIIEIEKKQRIKLKFKSEKN